MTFATLHLNREKKKTSGHLISTSYGCVFFRRSVNFTSKLMTSHCSEKKMLWLDINPSTANRRFSALHNYWYSTLIQETVSKQCNSALINAHILRQPGLCTPAAWLEQGYDIKISIQMHVLIS